MAEIEKPDTPTNVVDDINKLNQELNTKYADVIDNDYGLNFELRDGRLHITDMYLKDAERGKGIGSQIFDEIKQFADNNNLEISLYNDGDFNTTFWENKNFQEWSFKNNVDFANTPDDKLGLFILDTDTPTNVVDDFKLSGTMGGNTTPTGVNIAYANVEDLEQFIQFDRKAEGNLEQINNIKKTILDKGYLYDTAYEGGVVFGVIVDEAGNVQIPEGNHRLQALIDVAKETGQEIYVPINPMLTSTGGGNKVQLTNSDNAYNSMKQLLTDMLEENKNFNVERTISEKLGEPGTRIIGLDSYTYPGGAPGTSTTQSNIKKFFNSIGINAITYDELPDNSIYKTGVNTFTDTPTNVVDDVVVTRALSNAKMVIPVDADGNIILYRATNDPNLIVTSDFKDIGTTGQAGLGKQNYYSIDEMYAYLYSRPTINKNVYKFETNIKANQVLNLQSPTAKQLEVLSKIDINEEDLKNWYMQITGESKVNTAIQNNLDYLLDNDIKAIGNNLTGPTAGVFEYEIVPIITEKTQTEIKPVSQLILDPNWEGTDRILNVENELFESTKTTRLADKYLPIDVNDPNTKYRPVYYVDEEGIGRKAKDFQFSEQPIENNLVKDNLIEVPVDTNTNVNIVNDTYVLSTDTFTNVVPESPIVFAPDITGEAYDEIEDLLLDLRDKYADVLDIGQDGDPALYFDVQTRYTEEMQGVGINFELIEVSSEHQNKGIGTEILNEVKKIATKHKIPISATAYDTSPTGFFAKQGFLSGEDMVWIPDNIDPKYIVEKSGGSLGAAKLNDPLVFDSWVDNYAKTTTSFVDNLPLSTTVKNQFNNLVQGRAKNLATPGGVADAVDVWELGVLGLMIAAVAYKEYDEVPKILTNKAVDMFNSMTSSYGIPPVPKEQYDLDYEFINKVVETGEKFMPTDIIIKKVGDVVKGAAETGAVTGFGYVPTTPEKTDTMETTQKIQPGVQEEKMFEQAKPKKRKPTGGAGAKIL